MSLVLKAQIATLDESTGSEKKMRIFLPELVFMFPACHQYGIHPTERLMVRRHGTSSSWIRETYDEPCSTLEAAQACKQWFQPIWGLASPVCQSVLLLSKAKP
ncbi:hypothetical protein Tco_0635561 [Tanacetum coccineum]